MARIRSIKPEFWGHPIMGQIDDASKCLALALLNLADDEGYFLADPRLVRSFARPFDEDSTIIRRCLEQLEKAGWIEVRTHPSHGEIGVVLNFHDHQKIDRPTPSKIKNYFLDESSTNPRRPLDIGTGNREQGEKIVEPPLEPPTRQPRKVAPKKPPADSLPEILGRETTASLWEDFWLLSGIWPETSNIRKKDSARAYVEARKSASHECIFAWAEWTLEQSCGKITTLAAWLSNQDWQGRQEQRSRLAATA